MAKIPKAVLEKSPVWSHGLPLRGRGKVRDSYDIPGHPDKMLVVASDRCSIFDFVLNVLIQQKGEILTALNFFWLKSVIGNLCDTDFIACGNQVDAFLPPGLRGNTELLKRATVVRLLQAPEIEDIVRFVLTGSGWESYQKTGTICGHKLPAGLVNGSMLPFPLYTPTTKAVEGHDLHITVDEAVAKCGFKRERLALQIAGLLASFASSRGILMADTKFEFSGLTLVDEKGTPDASRFVDKLAYEKAFKAGKFPASLDKQFVRNWGIEKGINKLDPENPGHVEMVHSLEVPKYEAKMTTEIYRYIFWRLTGKKIEVFQREDMNLEVSVSKPNVSVVVGSESDLPQMEGGLTALKNAGIVPEVIVMSCHRNPDEVRSFAAGCNLRDIVIAGAGEAAALPGIMKSWMSYFQIYTPVIGVAFKGKDEKADKAAKLSIENLPGQPVELDVDGNAYFGPAGFAKACEAAITHEFLPKKVEVKPMKRISMSTE
jgi:phosphoribosylaminoimidazole-succinocarboxamide synthase